MRTPKWATHTARFCGIVPCWFADRVMFPLVQWAFSLGAELFDWDVWPITLTGDIPPHSKEKE